MAKTIERTLLKFIIKETFRGILHDMGRAAGKAALQVLADNINQAADNKGEPPKK